MNNSNKRISVPLSGALYQALKAEARIKGVSVAHYAATCLREGFERRDNIREGAKNLSRGERQYLLHADNRESFEHALLNRRSSHGDTK